MAVETVEIQGIGSTIAVDFSIEDSVANYLGVESIVLVATTNLLEDISTEDSDS